MSREIDSVAPSIEQPIRTHAILHSLYSLYYLYSLYSILSILYSIYTLYTLYTLYSINNSVNSIIKIDFRAHVYNKVYLLIKL